MILKLPDAFTLFNASLAFLMYHLFESVTVSKPYASDFETSVQYLVCSGLHVRRPTEIIHKLQQIKAKLATSNVEGCFDLKAIEDEHFFLNYLQQHNEELLYLQIKIMHRAVKTIDGLWLPTLACFRMKEQLLNSFDLPCVQTENDLVLEPEFRTSQPEKPEPKQDALEQKFKSMTREEHERNVKGGDDVLKFFDEQRRRERKMKQEEIKRLAE
jgi:hypothetical protein